MTEIEKTFVKMTIAELKRRHKPVDVMIQNLYKTNKELAEYADLVKNSVKIEDLKELKAQFRRQATEAIESSDDRQQTAKDFLNAMHYKW